MIETILFDLDGTLIDTEPTAALALQECFREWGIAVTREDAGMVTGRTWAAAFAYLTGKYPLPLPQERALEVVMKRYREILETNLPVVPGSVEAVRALAKSYPMGLVSGSSRADILWALGKLGVLESFRVILGAEDYSQSKPSPEGYEKALRLLGGTAARALVFEDSQAGISAALGAGAWVVAVTSTNHFAQNLSRAHHRITNLTGVNPDWVARHSAGWKNS